MESLHIMNQELKFFIAFVSADDSDQCPCLSRARMTHVYLALQSIGLSHDITSCYVLMRCHICLLAFLQDESVCVRDSFCDIGIASEIIVANKRLSSLCMFLRLCRFLFSRFFYYVHQPTRPAIHYFTVEI